MGPCEWKGGVVNNCEWMSVVKEVFVESVCERGVGVFEGEDVR